MRVHMTVDLCVFLAGSVCVHNYACEKCVLQS